MTKIFSEKRDRQYYRNLAVFAMRLFLVLGILLYFGIPILQVYFAMHPNRFPIGDISPADIDLEYEDVTLIAEDGIELKGWYIPSRNKAAVILVHAFNGNRTGMIFHAELLAKHGYGVLLNDTRTQGESGGDLYALGWDDHMDVMAAVDYLQQRPDVDPDKIGALGLSAGSKAALYTVTQTDSIAAVVAEGTRWRTFQGMMIEMKPKWYIWIPTEWVSYKYAEIVSGNINPTPLKQAISQMAPVPIMLIAAEAELSNSQAYYDAAKEPKEIWIRNEPGHQIDAIHDQPDEYERRVIGFMDQYLLPER
ncbi:MAG: prolyl oligopeptidase family serine peptidase [Anaerolineaceae bacterium]|nr:prolyl oligopeptidase family serine peptidase [Anaerolineaceae bacterium]